MFNHNAIQCALYTVVDGDNTSDETLKKIRQESENLCESIEYGLMELGEMMNRLGNLADEEQDFDHCAMNNNNVKHIGELIRANAYFLNTLRTAAANATFHLNGGYKEAK